MAAVLAGIAVVAMVGCQWQMVALDQTHTCLPRHHRAPVSQTTAELHCPVRQCPMAILPMVVSLTSLSLVVPHATALVLDLKEFAFPLFIPPRLS